MKDVNLAQIFKLKRKRVFHRSSSTKWELPSKKGKLTCFRPTLSELCMFVLVASFYVSVRSLCPVHTRRMLNSTYFVILYCLHLHPKNVSAGAISARCTQVSLATPLKVARPFSALLGDRDHGSKGN